MKKWVVNDKVAKTPSVAHTAFLPRPRESGTSLYRTEGVKEERLLRIGQSIANGSKAHTLFGWGEISAAAIREVELSIKRGWLPSLHAEISGWPPEDSKDARLSLAQKLAGSTTFHANPGLKK